jgi:hypothetical protein
MALDGSLPPLSTGRIGRATSRNGLAWVKDGTGSESEDARDVTLGLNKDSWWGFDTAHVGLGNVLLPMSTPAVLSDAGVFLMYYHGGSEEKTLAVDYVSDEAARKLQDAIKDKEVKGMKMRIGVALSQDGISFGRVEGDDPSGACIVPFDKSDPNQKLDQINAKLEEELYCAWPEVVLNQQGDESNFLMYYSTMTKSDKIKCIAQAVSPDGFRWTKTGVCIRPDPEGYDAGGCARCCVLRDASYDSESGIWKEENSWIMYYEGVSAVDGKHRIMEARSGDGVKWTKAGVALAPRDDVWAWDNGGVGSPHVLRYALNTTKTTTSSGTRSSDSLFSCFLDWTMAPCECTTLDKVLTKVPLSVWQGRALGKELNGPGNKRLLRSRTNRCSYKQPLHLRTQCNEQY